MSQECMVSVIIPTYNRLWALPRSVSQFFNDPLVGEILVVNDASTDATRQWLDEESKKHPILKPIHHETNRGATGARNTGIEAVRCEYILFWDDDMLLMPHGGVQILFDELTRLGGDMIAPASSATDNQTVPDLSPPVNTSGGLVECDLLVNRWTIMMRHLSPGVLPRVTFRSPLIYGWTLQRRELYGDVRYADDLAPTYFRDETDIQLAIAGRGGRLLACPYVYALDMRRPAKVEDGGCHSHGILLRYDLIACRNNWRMLRRRRAAIRSALHIRLPIVLLQAIFMFDRLAYRLPRKLAGHIMRSIGLRRQKSP